MDDSTAVHVRHRATNLTKKTAGLGLVKACLRNHLVEKLAAVDELCPTKGYRAHVVRWLAHPQLRTLHDRDRFVTVVEVVGTRDVWVAQRPHDVEFLLHRQMILES